MLNKKLILILLFFAAIAFTSCHFNFVSFNLEKDKNAAEKVTDRLYEKIKMQDYKGTFPLYSDKFFVQISQEKLSRLYTTIKGKLGVLEETKLTIWQTKHIDGTEESGVYTLVYTNKYSKFDAVEKIDLVLDDNKQIKIVGYHIESDGFLQ